MESQFITFKPIELNPNPSLEEVSQYHKDNNMFFEDDYLNNLLNLKTPPPVTHPTSTENNTSSYDIPGILKSFAKPKEQEISNTSYISSSHSAPKNKEEFLEIYGPSAEVASKRTGISKDLLLAQIALETG